MQIATNKFQQELKEHGDFSFPLLISKEKLSRYESGSFLWHWHPEIELTLVTKGQMLYHVNNNTYHLLEGQALFGNSSTLHSGQMYDKNDCEYTSITFDSKLIYGYENSLIQQRYVTPIVQNYQLLSLHFDHSASWHLPVIKLLHKIIAIYDAPYDSFELDLISLLHELWKYLYLNCSPSNEATVLNRSSFDRIRIIMQFVEEHYTEDLTLEMIADSIHVCRSECSRLFKKNMGLSLFDYITQYRIEKSASYLSRTDLSITKISELIGFHDSNYFAKVFHKQKGCSPSKYRKNIQNKCNV